MAPSFRIAVVGSGAIGCYYGAKLASYGRDVHFLMRGDVAEIRRFGIRIRGKGENLRLVKVNHHASTEEIGPCDLVLVALKATSNSDLTKLIPPLLREKTMLLTLQNGFGNEEFLAKNFGAERVLGGLCFVCLNRVSPGVIEYYDHGHVAIGEYNRCPQPRTHDVAWEFKRCGAVCGVVENLGLERWRKLIWNIPFNGLSVTAGGLDTAAILSDDHLRRECLALMDEVILAANKCGFPLPAAAALEQVERTESMGAYKPSTLIDFQAGRPLEIEAIWGEPLRRAAVAGAFTPRLEDLYEKLKTMDLKRPGEITEKRRCASEVKKTDHATRATPRITVHNRQRAVRVPLAALQEFARRALKECLKIPRKNAGELVNLDDLSVILVSDRRMAELHRRFLLLSRPTDVITFQHGEIFVSAQTARRHARRFGNSFEGELRLYIAHGLLHLHGFDDKEAADAAEMERAQEKLVAAVMA